MSKFTILSDSCSDLPLDYILKHNLTILPLGFEIEGKSYKNFPDERDIKIVDFYSLMRDKKNVITSQVTPEGFMSIAEPLLKQGHDILAFSISSALSGTFNSMRIGALELLEHYPNRKIIVIDSLGASLGEGMLVNTAVEMQEAGKTLEETAAFIEANKLKLNHLFTVDDLGTLKRGGRLTASKAFLGTVLNLKPVLLVDHTGHLVPWGTKHGRKVALKTLLEKMEENITDDRVIFISHGDCLAEAEKVKASILEAHPNNKIFVMNPVGPAIGAHSGPGTIAIFFYGHER